MLLSAANFKNLHLLLKMLYTVVGIIIREKFTGKRKHHKGISTVSNCLFLWVEHMRICNILGTYLYTFLIKITTPWHSSEKKRFLVNLKTERNALKFAMFMEKENPCSFFRFSFRATFIFPLWMPWSMST